MSRPTPLHPWVRADLADQLQAEAETIGLQELLPRWVERLERQVGQSRAAGHARFRAGAAGGADRWLDTLSPELLGALGDQVVGAWLRAGEASSWGAAHTAWLHKLERAVLAEAGARLDRWQACPTLTERYLLVSARALPASVRAALGVDPDAVLDTRALPPALAAELHDLPLRTARLLHGDNRDACRALLHEGSRLHAVLEDPPYDTGLRDLPYRDHWPDGAWRALMREHLGLVRELLLPEGVLAVHIDEHRSAELDRLLGEAFGTGKLGLAVWDKRNPKNDSLGLGTQHELIGFAVPDRAAFRRGPGLRRRKPHAAEMLAQAANLVAQAGGVNEAVRASFRAWVRVHPELSGGERAYQHLDEAGEVYRPVSMAWPKRDLPPEAFFVPLVHPVTGQPCPVPARGWRNAPATMAALLASGQILFGQDHTVQPTRKYLLRDMQWERLPSVLQHGGADDGLLSGLGLRFPHAKPVELLMTLIEAVAPSEQAVVADLFAGSGSAAHALLLLNRQTHAQRQIVLAEIDPQVVAKLLLPRLCALFPSAQDPVGLLDAVRVEVLGPPAEVP